MDQIKEFFTPFIAQLVWQVRRGHGSFLTMEFGTPHLAIREPIAAKSDRPERVKRTLQRRHVIVTGDWHFWVQYGDWHLSTSSGELTSSHPRGSELDECLCDLDGQKLTSIRPGGGKGDLRLSFDLGGVLKISPSAEIADDQWSLHSWGGDIVICRHDGTLVFEKANLDQRVYESV